MTTTTFSRPEHGYWLLGSTRCKILVAGKDTGGEIAVVDGRMPAGGTARRCTATPTRTSPLSSSRAARASLSPTRCAICAQATPR